MNKNIRYPEAAGLFYPDNGDLLKKQLKKYLQSGLEQTGVLGAIVPHAGWVCSGAAAGLVYSTLGLFDRYIILGPNHHGFGSPISVYPEGEWVLPNGNMKIDSELVHILLKKTDAIKQVRVAW